MTCGVGAAGGGGGGGSDGGSDGFISMAEFHP